MRRMVLAALIALAGPALAVPGNLGMSLSDVDTRFNRAATALGSDLRLTTGECSNAQRTVCSYTLNDALAVVATARGPGQPLEEIVAIYINRQSLKRVPEKLFDLLDKNTQQNKEIERFRDSTKSGHTLGMRQAVLLCELVFAMTIPDLPAKARAGYVDDLLGQIGKTDMPRITVDRFRYRLDLTQNNSLFLTVEAVR